METVEGFSVLIFLTFVILLSFSSEKCASSCVAVGPNEALLKAGDSSC